MAKAVRSSPILGAVTSMISAESGHLVTNSSKFRHTFELNVAICRPDPQQARKTFNETDIAELAETMASQGQLQPILVRRQRVNDQDSWVIVAGERRWRAARLNGWPTILAIEHNGDAEVVGLIENLQRVDLSPVEEARGLQRLISERRWPQEKAAQALGKSKGEISSILRILSLPAALLDKVLTSELPLSKNALIELARVDDDAERDALVKLAMTGGLTIRAIRDMRETGTISTPEPVARNRTTTVPLAGKIAGTTRYLQSLKRAEVTLDQSGIAALRGLRDAVDALIAG